MKQSFFHFNITLTWSKIVALVIIVLAFVMDFMCDKQGQVFMYTIPFAVFLITGKQMIDSRKAEPKPE